MERYCRKLDILKKHTVWLLLCCNRVTSQTKNCLSLDLACAMGYCQVQKGKGKKLLKQSLKHIVVQNITI